MAGKKRTILIVEDDASLRHTFSEMLKQDGFLALEAENGQQGLEMALSKHPALIVLDVMMPVMDGMAMLEQLRQDEWGKTAQVLILTNLGDTEKISEAIMHGPCEYLVKSDWKVEDIIAKIRRKLGK